MVQDHQDVCPCIQWPNGKIRRVVFWIWQTFTKPCETLGQEEVTEAQKEDVGKPENGDGAADPKGAEDDSKTAESQAVEV